MIAKFLISILFLSLLIPVGCQKAEAHEEYPPDSKLICLFFDDGYVNQYEVVLPILLKHDYKASFSVITGHIGTGHGMWEYMDKEELMALAECGMDIACHTKTHHDLTENLTDEQLREEIVQSKEHLENMGFEIKTMVYPYFNWDDRVIEFVTEAGYVCARAGWSEERAYDLRTTDPKEKYHVAAWNISNQDIEEFKTITNNAGNHSVVSLVYHLILDDGPEKTSTTVADFETQMSYLKESGFTVVLLPDLFAQ